MRLAVLALAAALSAAPLVAEAAQAGTEVDELTIYAPADVRLTLAVGGQMTRDQVVVSAPVGLHCGADAFKYETGQNHQCWLWVRRNQTVMLTAQAEGAYGADWTVAWSGCEPVAGGPACTLKADKEAVIAAVFTRGAP